MGFSNALAAGASGAASGAMSGLATANPLGIAGGAGIGLAAGILSYVIESIGEEDAREIEQEARRQYGTISDESVRAAAEKVLGPTALAKITADPRFREAQENSLAALKEISEGGGYNLEDRANLNRIQNENDRRASAQRAAALERLAARGIAGSGAEIQQNIAAQQDAANRDAQAGLDIAAAGRKRALDAIRARGGLAGQLEAADYERQSRAATAQDVIDKFNNTEQYGRAQDAWARARQNADRQLGFGQRDADLKRQAGQRLAGAVGGTVKGAGDIVTGYYGGNGQALTSAPASTPRAAGDGAASDDDAIIAMRDNRSEDD